MKNSNPQNQTQSKDDSPSQGQGQKNTPQSVEKNNPTHPSGSDQAQQGTGNKSTPQQQAGQGKNQMNTNSPDNQKQQGDHSSKK